MTVTVTAELIPPSTDVTVISAHPSETPVTVPSSETAATEGSDEANVTAFSVAFSGRTVYLSLYFPFSGISRGSSTMMLST